MRQQLLQSHVEAQLGWEVSDRMFPEFILGSGYDAVSEARRLALHRSTLCAERYRLCSEPSRKTSATRQELGWRIAFRNARLQSTATRVVWK